ncbi:DNA adenine methylase [Siccirubricoccus sp. KC 17139]|uniref:site-specific DNA-methyltransferase (adenine-specific) n=1 Tax=Siccirubricoccus soli TaxID=2899147 RepID=A0ABT1CZ11_9PROT|nr:DNA adenine methylase [Siccirubricoccus soli]MCO6414911.1 DNA adenine methylase [Siccirubricoccus soli]MCP2681041.1 DNA adenine methylase [Siccirubricoccus soli]
MIKYLGSKRALLPQILSAIGAAAPPGARVADLFSGTARVGHALKTAGYRVLANDHNAFAHTLATCYVQADADRWGETAQRILADLERLPPRHGWFTETYCIAARYFHPENGARIEAMREGIAALGAEPELEAVLLTALLEAADRVDSTAGLQMAYMKRWAPRALNPIQLRLPKLLPRPAAGGCAASCAEAEAAAAGFEGELAYLDPPYNQHSYLGNYHLWETLVRWDQPEVYGVAMKRADVRTRRSAFNSRPGIGPALARTIAALRCPRLVVSFSDEGYLSRQALEAMLAPRGHLQVIEIPYGRYVGAKIGIHNPQGEKVGTVGRLTNTEYLFVVSETRIALPSSQAA